MRPIHLCISVVLLFSLTGISDCRETEPELSELEKLPPITSSGEYTFGCLVDGVAVVAASSLDISAIYQFGMLQVQGRSLHTSVSFYVTDPEFGPRSYVLNDHPERYLDFGDDQRGSFCSAKSDTTSVSCILSISRFELKTGIVSGTFSFKITPPGCATFVVTEGRFDTKFTQ